MYNVGIFVLEFFEQTIAQKTNSKHCIPIYFTGFIVVAACVMTFEARDSAAKVVPARFKLSTNLPPPSVCSHGAHGGHSNHGNYNRHESLKTSSVQTSQHTRNHTHMQKHFHCHSSNADRRALTQSFMHFSRGLPLETQKKNLLKVPQVHLLNQNILFPFQ